MQFLSIRSHCCLFAFLYRILLRFCWMSSLLSCLGVQLVVLSQENQIGNFSFLLFCSVTTIIQTFDPYDRAYIASILDIFIWKSFTVSFMDWFYFIV
jgi:hypothetical protein